MIACVAGALLVVAVVSTRGYYKNKMAVANKAGSGMDSNASSPEMDEDRDDLDIWEAKENK